MNPECQIIYKALEQAHGQKGELLGAFISPNGDRLFKYEHQLSRSLKMRLIFFDLSLN